MKLSQLNMMKNEILENFLILYTNLLLLILILYMLVIKLLYIKFVSTKYWPLKPNIYLLSIFFKIKLSYYFCIL